MSCSKTTEHTLKLIVFCVSTSPHRTFVFRFHQSLESSVSNSDFSSFWGRVNFCATSSSELQSERGFVDVLIILSLQVQI